MNRLILIPLFLIACGGEDPSSTVVIPPPDATDASVADSDRDAQVEVDASVSRDAGQDEYVAQVYIAELANLSGTTGYVFEPDDVKFRYLGLTMQTLELWENGRYWTVVQSGAAWGEDGHMRKVENYLGVETPETTYTILSAETQRQAWVRFTTLDDEFFQLRIQGQVFDTRDLIRSVNIDVLMKIRWPPRSPRPPG